MSFRIRWERTFNYYKSWVFAFPKIEKNYNYVFRVKDLRGRCLWKSSGGPKVVVVPTIGRNLVTAESKEKGEREERKRKRRDRCMTSKRRRRTQERKRKEIQRKEGKNKLTKVICKV